MLVQRDQVGPLNDRQERYLTTVQRNARRLKALIDDLLDVSRIESGSLELSVVNIDVVSQIRDVLESMQGLIGERGQHVALNLPRGLPEVRADALRFSQVLTNLLSNACKYAPDGATATITATAQGRFIRIDVADTGMGISADGQSRLFSKFFRADNSSTQEVSGTGLGLFITKSIVEAHGGEIWAKSEEGKGSSFSFTLPTGGTDDGLGIDELDPRLAASMYS